MEKTKNSLIQKIVFIMFGLLLLSAMLFGTMCYYSYLTIEKNTDEEIEHLLSVYASSLEHSLNSNDMNLLTIAQEQSSLEKLSNEDEAKRYFAAVHLMDLVKRLRSNNDSVDMLLATGNLGNSLSDTSARMKLAQRDEIIAFMNQNREERKNGEEVPTGTKGWILQEVGETLYLTRTYDTLDYSVSAWIKLDSLSEKIRELEENSKRHLFFADSYGKCIGSVIPEDNYEKWKQEGKQWSCFIGEVGLQIVCFEDNENTFEKVSLIQEIVLLSISSMLAILL